MAPTVIGARFAERIELRYGNTGAWFKESNGFHKPFDSEFIREGTAAGKPLSLEESHKTP